MPQNKTTLLKRLDKAATEIEKNYESCKAQSVAWKARFNCHVCRTEIKYARLMRAAIARLAR